MAAKTYSVPAVSCVHCKRAIEQALGALDGVDSVEVDVEGKKLDVVFDEARLSEDALRQRLADEGYPVA